MGTHGKAAFGAIESRQELATRRGAAVDALTLSRSRSFGKAAGPCEGCLKLLCPAFGLMRRAIDGSALVGDPSPALVLMWSALENIFSPARVDLKFRVSGNMSSFLKPPDASRVDVQRGSAKLFDERSAAAHGKPHDTLAPAAQTCGLTRRVLLKILVCDEVPKAAALEKALLVGR